MSQSTPERHPLTDQILNAVDGGSIFDRIDEVDEAIREHLAPAPHVVESGVRFPDMPTTKVAMAAQFIESGNQMSMAIIGTEPVLLIQPEFDADTNEVTLITTAVDLPPEGLVLVLEALLDGTWEIVRIQDQQRAEIAEADAALRKANEDFELAQLPETPEG